MKKPDLFIYYNNVGNNYYLQDNYREALPSFEKAASLVKDDPDKTWDYYTARANIAEILINLKEAELLFAAPPVAGRIRGILTCLSFAAFPVRCLRRQHHRFSHSLPPVLYRPQQADTTEGRRGEK